LVDFRRLVLGSDVGNSGRSEAFVSPRALDVNPAPAHMSMMARKGSFGLAIAAATFVFVGASPIAARSHDTSTMTMGHQPTRQTRVLSIPGYPTAYILTPTPKDTRSPRQRCIDNEVAKESGSPSGLALAAIDLKCSQR